MYYVASFVFSFHYVIGEILDRSHSCTGILKKLWTLSRTAPDLR